MRRRDYRCPDCGYVFEFVDSMSDPIYQQLPCQNPNGCGGQAIRLVARGVQIGKIYQGVHVVDFPADPHDKSKVTTMSRDEVERRIAMQPDDTGDVVSDEVLSDRFDRIVAQMDSGNYKPPAELTTEQKESLAKALKRASGE